MNDLILVFDMDGTCADFNKEFGKRGNIFQTEGFFSCLEPFPSLDKIGLLPNTKYILSAIPRDMEYAKEEKREWLKKHMPFIKEENIIFCYTDEVKAEVFKKVTGLTSLKNTVLFDDFKNNLITWKEQGGLTVKKRSSTKGVREYDAVLTDFALINFCLSEIASNRRD